MHGALPMIRALGGYKLGLLLSLVSLFGCEESQPEGIPWRPYYGCPAGTQNCDGQCLDVITSAANCGACGRVCSAGAQCQNAVCVCAVGVSCVPSPSPTATLTTPVSPTPSSTSTVTPTPPLPGGPLSDPAIGVDTRYETALRLALHFYAAQRAGKQSNWLMQAVAGGAEGCFLADGKSLGVDLSGGWFDAGDHIKPTLTIAYSALLLLKAYEAFTPAFDDLYGPIDNAAALGASVRGTPNGIPDVLDEVRFATDYLAKIPVNGALVMQVGNTELDHRRFFSCTATDDFELSLGGEMNGATRVGREVILGNGGAGGGMAAASLALMSRLYAPFDSGVAAQYLNAAKAIYAVAGDTSQGPGPYPGGKPLWVKLCGAAELFRATSDTSFRAEITRLQGGTGQHNWVAGWDNPHDFCLESAYRATSEQSFLGTWQSNLNLTVSTAANTTGLIANSEWGDWGVLRNATTSAFSAALFGALRHDGSNQELALQQVDWVLGSNPSARSYLIGFGDNPPSNPHHRNACEQQQSGPSDGIPCRHVLSGALVSGPSPNKPYADRVTDFVLNEVSLDYNAGLVGLLAHAVYRERGGK